MLLHGKDGEQHKFLLKVINELLQRLKYLLGMFTDINVISHTGHPQKLEDSHKDGSTTEGQGMAKRAPHAFQETVYRRAQRARQRWEFWPTSC